MCGPRRFTRFWNTRCAKVRTTILCDLWLKYRFSDVCFRCLLPSCEFACRGECSLPKLLAFASLLLNRKMLIAPTNFPVMIYCIMSICSEGRIFSCFCIKLWLESNQYIFSVWTTFNTQHTYSYFIHETLPTFRFKKYSAIKTVPLQRKVSATDVKL